MIPWSLAACRANPRVARIAQREAIVNLGADPRTLDPSLATDVASARAILCFMRGLTTLEDDGHPRPELAESWTVSPDRLVYEFKLRPARWTNGEPVTADDFVYTWTRRVLNPAFGAQYANQLFYIQGAEAYYKNPALGPESVQVEALAPDRLRVRLVHPAPFFLQLVAHNSYFPVCRQTDEINPDWAKKPETYVGCGPFVLKKYTPGYEIDADKNPDYWDAVRVELQRLVLRMIEQESTALIAFENGELDATEPAPRPDLDALRATPYLRFSPQYATYFLNLNCRKPPLDNVLVRRALALAVDRESIVKVVTRAGEQPAFGIVPPKLYTTPPKPYFPDADYDEARRLLAEAGYPGGRGLPQLQYIYNTLETHRQIAQVLQETWRRELGVDVRVENQEFKVTIDNRQMGRFDIARAGWVADFADPINFLEILDTESQNNDSHWSDPQYDAMLAACRAEADPYRREQLLLDAESYMVSQMPIIPIYIYTSPYLVDPALEGFVLNPMGMFDPARLALKKP